MEVWARFAWGWDRWLNEGTLRKVLAIALLAVFGLAFASPLLALSGRDEGRLPACCRRGGAHHCMAASGASSPGVQTKSERCPYCPAAVPVQVHGGGFAPSTAQAVYAGVVAHPAVVAQTECRLRIAEVRARGLRGPPVGVV